MKLDIEMETGTGKTYCYIKTFFELNRRYGWSKFIEEVPSIAIREGVFQSLDRHHTEITSLNCTESGSGPLSTTRRNCTTWKVSVLTRGST